MILLLWLSLLFLSLVISVLGYFTDDEPYLTIGCFILFLLGIAIVTGQLEYQTGETHTYAYTPGYCSGNCTIQTAITGDTVVYTYTAWNDATSHIVGYLLAALGGIGFALSLRNTRNRGPADEE